MLRIWLAGLLLPFLTLNLSAQTTPAESGTKSDKEGFFSLFNGKDLSGWRFSNNMPTAANWKVEDGVIKLTGGGNPHLASRWDFEDFDIRLEWRGMQPKYNSGFYIRSGPNVGTNQLNLAKGSEGGLVGGKITGAKPVPDLQNPPKEWNEWRVLAVGGKVTFWCNGKLAWEGTDLKNLTGHVGFQAEGAPMEFRNLRVKELAYTLLGESEWKGDGKWTAEDVTGKAEGWSITSNKSYSDFTLRGEWKGAKGSSVLVGLRGSKDKAVVRLGDNAEANGSVEGKKVAKSNDLAAGEMNTLEIRVEKNQATVLSNGKVVSEAVPFAAGSPESGPITIQATGDVTFHALRIKAKK